MTIFLFACVICVKLVYNTVEGDVNTVVNINVEAGKRVDNRGIKEPAKAEVREKTQRKKIMSYK